MRSIRTTLLALATAALLLPGLAPTASAQDITDGGRLLGGSSNLVPQGSSVAPELSQVEDVDPERYMGLWYQVAAIPQPFTLQCTHDTTAEYALIDDSTVSVRNFCGSHFSSDSAIEGTATIRDTDTNASLRVNFPGVPFQDDNGPVNYRITYLAEDYSLAIVGDPQRRSGFVLSRTQSLSAEQWSLVNQTVSNRGWWPCAFLTVPMAEGRRDVAPVCTLG
ncbi:lipocalin family protein [Corynebacterium testudinoris]|uniref:Bacterial lipocalin n=1 Tax=Corynebacterium testudinoris TaxID=136857 RepID=A0A0G3H438_9CORY|nr:lipocalin family protein [Corynebacterium testudinoris]AKK07530.1 bacterial lipocalin [Corynebacterium testudinoris]